MNKLLDPGELILFIDDMPYTPSYFPIEKGDMVFNIESNNNDFKFGLCAKVIDNNTILINEYGMFNPIDPIGKSVNVENYQRLAMTHYFLN